MNPVEGSLIEFSRNSVRRSAPPSATAIAILPSGTAIVSVISMGLPEPNFVREDGPLGKWIAKRE